MQPIIKPENRLPQNTKEAADRILDWLEARKNLHLILDGTTDTVYPLRYAGGSWMLSLKAKTPDKSHKKITFSTKYDLESETNLREMLRESTMRKGFPDSKDIIRYEVYGTSHHSQKVVTKKGGPKPLEGMVKLEFYWEISKSDGVPQFRKLEN